MINNTCLFLSLFHRLLSEGETTSSHTHTDNPGGKKVTMKKSEKNSEDLHIRPQKSGIEKGLRKAPQTKGKHHDEQEPQPSAREPPDQGGAYRKALAEPRRLPRPHRLSGAPKPGTSGGKGKGRKGIDRRKHPKRHFSGKPERWR